MGVKGEWHTTISFYICLKYTLMYTAELIKEAYKEETLREVAIKNWHKWYTWGHKTVGLALCDVQKNTVTVETNINTISVAIDNDWHVSTWRLAILLTF